MKPLNSFLILILSIVLISPVTAQYRDNAYYERKANTYSYMKITGLTLGGSGIALAVTGIVTLATISYQEQYDYWGNVSYEPMEPGKFVAGIGCIVLGVPLVAAGTPLAIIGGIKTNKYRQKAKNVTLMPAPNGFYFSYRF